MTEKNIFVKLFLPLNISDFNLFLCENCNPPLQKSTPSKSWGPFKPLLFENLVGGSGWRFRRLIIGYYIIIIVIIIIIIAHKGVWAVTRERSKEAYKKPD